MPNVSRQQYCKKLKSLLSTLNLPAKVFEVDKVPNGDAVLDAVKQRSGCSTIPQLFRSCHIHHS